MDIDKIEKLFGCISPANSFYKLIPVFYYLLVVLLAGCATPQHDVDVTLLDFLEKGKTTKEITMLKLGQPSASFEDEKFLTYRLGYVNDRGYFLLDQSRNWYRAKYSLVLVFDEEGILCNHSLVEVR